MLLPRKFHRGLSEGYGAEKPFRAALEFLIWSASTKLRIGAPSFFVRCELKREEGVDEEFGDPTFTKEAN